MHSCEFRSISPVPTQSKLTIDIITAGSGYPTAQNTKAASLEAHVELGCLFWSFYSLLSGTTCERACCINVLGLLFALTMEGQDSVSLLKTTAIP